MTLAAQLVIRKESGGTPVSIHGAHGQLHLTTVRGERFRRPVAVRAGYQRLGEDVDESTLEYWQACATSPAANAFINTVNALCYQSVIVDWKEYSDVRCVVTSTKVTLSRACKGPLITGSTYATWRVEGTITLEVATE